MVWATVSSWYCFCWLYRASPSLAAKNIINLILVLTIWWCPRVESSLVLLEECVCYDQCVFWQTMVRVMKVMVISLKRIFKEVVCTIVHNRVLPRERTGHSKHALPTTQEMILHMDITKWSIQKSDWLYSLQSKMEKLYTVSKNKTGSWLWLRSWTPYCQIQT